MIKLVLKRVLMVALFLTILIAFMMGMVFAGGNDDSLFDGGELTMFTSQTDWQMMSFALKTKKGSLIVIDGGRREDAAHLAKYIQANGGRVNAWFLTHAHDDHSGALAEVIENDDLDVVIDRIYYAFPPEPFVERYEPVHFAHLVDINQALKKVEEGNKYLLNTPGEELIFDDVVVKVMTDSSIYYQEDTLNNSSMVYRIEMNGKRILFLGDLSVLASRQLLKDYDAAELKSDIVQMSHHGQAYIEYEVYQKAMPDICLWPAPLWLWDNDDGSGAGYGEWSTLITRQWMEDLGVEVHYVSAGQDITLR